MKLNKLDKLMDNPRLVSGIHNYCDRWCERCPFTDRCLSFAMESQRHKKRGQKSGHSASHSATHIAKPSNDENEDFWEEVEDIFRDTLDLIRQMAEEAGVDLNDLDSPEVQAHMALNHQRSEDARRHDLAERSLEYIRQVDHWFEEAAPLFKKKGLALESMVRMNVSGVDVESEARALQNVVEVVRWYEPFIHVKLQRALHSQMDEVAEEDEEMRAFPKDSEGTAKVALIAMDRSIGAWGQLLRTFPERETPTLELLVYLDRLRRAVELQFPNARQFVRPGLDTISLLED